MITVKRLHRLLKLHKQAICSLLKEQYERSDDIEEQLDGTEPPYYLFYQDQQLVGLFLFESLSCEMAEGYLFGTIFQDEMLDCLLKELSLLGVKTLYLLSNTKKEHPVALKASYSYSEYLMIRKPMELRYSIGEEIKQPTLIPFCKKHRLFYEEMLFQLFQMSESEVQERVNSMLTEENMRGFVLIDPQNVPIGFCGCYDQASAVTLFDFAIVKQHQHLGYGSFLMSQVMRVLPVKKKKLLLQVSSQNIAAVSLYRKFGFEVGASLDYFFVPISEQ